MENTPKFQRAPTNIIFTAAILIIIVLSCVSVFQFKILINANRWVAHTYNVISAAHNSLYYMTYLEASQRSYLLFDNTNYVLSGQEAKKSLDSLVELTQDNPSQHGLAIKLSGLINKRIDLLGQMLKFKKRNDLSSSEAISLFRNAQILSDEIRSLTNQIVHNEFLLLRERNDNVIKNATLTNFVFISGQIISVVFLLIAFVIYNRADEKRKYVQGQLRSIIEGASDMIAALDLNYRYIIFNHAYQNEFKRLFNKQIFIGMSLDEALEAVPAVRSKLKESWKNSLDGKEYIQNIEFEHDGQKETYEITSSLIKDNQNNILGAVHIKRNITERINNQHALQKSMAELKDKNNKITLLLEMSDVMLACNSTNELSEIIARYCGKILNFSKGIFYIMHPSKDFLQASTSWGLPMSEARDFTQDECWALRLGHIHYAGVTETDLSCKHVNINDLKNTLYLCVPLRAQNDIYGLLYVEILKVHEHQYLTIDEKLLVNAFAELSALALANVRLREHLSYQSVRDPLTSLYNRRYLDEFLLKQIHQSERTSKPLSILMIDLDHFKRINDVHGHDAGDLVLKEFGHILTQDIRPGDFASRYGGEEFVIIFYDTDAKTAFKRAESIRKSISLLHVKFGAQDTGEITASIGIAEYPHDGRTSSELIEAADKALYVAKSNGRNKVVLFSQIQIILHA